MTRSRFEVHGRIAAVVLISSASLVARSVTADAPSGRYVVAGGGPSATVYDTKTKLTWQQAQAATTYAWSGATTYCGAVGPGWRLPSLTELQSIVDDSGVRPAIDPTAFPGALGGPGMPELRFWTSSVFVGMGGGVWVVDFTDGASYYDPETSVQSVRCVH
jgi:hypothetical protein